jgi:hypothetical protein
MFAKVAHEYHLPFIAVREANEGTTLQPSRSTTDIVLDAIVIAGPQVHPEEWKAFYLNAIKSLKPGLTEIIVHLGRDDAELQAVTVDHEAYGSAWRQRDDEVVTDPEFTKALQENHVVVIKWKDLQLVDPR